VESSIGVTRTCSVSLLPPILTTRSTVAFNVSGIIVSDRQFAQSPIQHILKYLDRVLGSQDSTFTVLPPKRLVSGARRAPSPEHGNEFWWGIWREEGADDAWGIAGSGKGVVGEVREVFAGGDGAWKEKAQGVEAKVAHCTRRKYLFGLIAHGIFMQMWHQWCAVSARYPIAFELKEEETIRQRSATKTAQQQTTATWSIQVRERTS